MIVIYKTPSDKIAFDKHYYEVHIPLAKKLPGLIKYEISHRSIYSPSANTDTYLIAILYFENLEAIKKAFASQDGKKCAEDRKILVPNENDIQIYLYESHNI